MTDLREAFGDDPTLGYLDCGSSGSSCFPQDRQEDIPNTCNWVTPQAYDKDVNPFLGFPGNYPYLGNDTCGKCKTGDSNTTHTKYGTCVCCTKTDESHQDASCNNAAGEIYDTGTYYKCITQDACSKKCQDKPNQRQHWVWDASCFNWMDECT